jgi:hypothetical protein
MSRARVTMHTADGREITLPLVQALALGRLAQDFDDPVWHRNDCGCCVSVHERDDDTRGYIIGADGKNDWVGPR